jgi:hypothetical protein
MRLPLALPNQKIAKSILSIYFFPMPNERLFGKNKKKSGTRIGYPVVLLAYLCKVEGILQRIPEERNLN